MSWFSDLVGFSESHAAVHANLTVAGTLMTSAANGRTFGIGTLTTPSLKELRAAVGPPRKIRPNRNLSLSRQFSKGAPGSASAVDCVLSKRAQPSRDATRLRTEVKTKGMSEIVSAE